MDTKQQLEADMIEFNNILSEAQELRRSKLYAYGISSYKITGTYGCAIRMFDKMHRILNFYQGNKGHIDLSKGESVRDNLIDILNYAAMAVMCLDEELRQFGKNEFGKNDIHDTD